MLQLAIIPVLHIKVLVYPSIFKQSFVAMHPSFVSFLITKYEFYLELIRPSL